MVTAYKWGMKTYLHIYYCSHAAFGRVCHAGCVHTIFGSGALVPCYTRTGDDARFARQVVDRFTTFAKTGNPNPQKAIRCYMVDSNLRTRMWPASNGCSIVITRTQSWSLTLRASCRTSRSVRSVIRSMPTILMTFGCESLVTRVTNKVKGPSSK